MERMWRKVNHSFGSRPSKSLVTAQSTDTVSSAGGFGEGQCVVASTSGSTTNNLPSSTATGRRLAASGQLPVPPPPSCVDKSLSQHVLMNMNSTASSERRRRRRRKNRARRSGVSCVGGGGGDNMSSSGGFYTIKESLDAAGAAGTGGGKNQRLYHQSNYALSQGTAPSGTVMMYPNPSRESCATTSITAVQTVTTTAATTATPDISLRQRAAAKLRIFNFHLNWDLHMTQCKPCGPRFGSGGGGNIITRRLCRNRRREDNELYRSNSFKFERFERKECIEELADTLQKQIAICDDYSLPVDFVKKRPSSFDPCLADIIPANSENWTAPSPQADFNSFAETQRHQQRQHQQPQNHQYQHGPPQPPQPAPISTLPSANAETALPFITTPNHTLPNQQPRPEFQQHQQYSIQLKSQSQRNQKQQQKQLRPTHPPLPNAIKQASVRVIEGYSDPKDSKRHKKVYHKKGKRRTHKNPRQQQRQNQKQQQQIQQEQQSQDNRKRKFINYCSDSSAPKSSDDEDNLSTGVPELNSPDSISDDLVRSLPTQSHRSPRKIAAAVSETSKHIPSPYYYSDLLKSKDSASVADNETKNKSRLSTASEPSQLTQPQKTFEPYRKSTIEVTDREERPEEGGEGLGQPELTSAFIRETNDTPKRYSFTEDGVHIIRCDSPSTSTSEESDCSECLKRREWHAQALALVRKTCNLATTDCKQDSVGLKSTRSPFAEDLTSMPPHRLLGPAVCACVAPTIGDDLDEYFRPRSIFYVHPYGVHECADCTTDTKNVSSTTSQSVLDSVSLAQSNNALDEDHDEMSGRTRQLYETAFDCKVTKSDDDLDEVDRITNHSVLLQFNNSHNVSVNATTETRPLKASHAKSRLECKRLKNSQNQAIQEKASNSGGNASGSGSSQTGGCAGEDTELVTEAVASSVTALASDLVNVHIGDQNIDQQNNTTASTSQLPIRGYTPSPPSTAPLPMKFPGKQDRFFINSIKSAPNLPSSNLAHPRLRDLRLPIQSSLRQQHQQASSLGTSYENSLTDSACVNPPFSKSHHTHHTPIGSGSRPRDRPRSFVLESGRVLELRKSHASHHHHVGKTGHRSHNYSSTESIATSSSGGSMESLRSSTSEGNRSTSSSESRHSTSLSSHSSESGSSSVAFPLRAPVVIHSKLHILSPISDKSSQEPASELSEHNKTQNASPEDASQPQRSQPAQNQLGSVTGSKIENVKPIPQLQIDALKKRRTAPNKALLHLTDEILGSDSGISLHSREDGKSATGLPNCTLPKPNLPSTDKSNHSGTNNTTGMAGGAGLPQDLRDLPFDMPKLRRRKTLQQDACTSGSATSVDLGDLPFDMPKLRRRLRGNQADINNITVHSTESSGISQASSSHSMRHESKASMKLDTATFRQNLTLNLNEPRQSNKFGSLDLRGLSSNKQLNLNLSHGHTSAVDLIDVSLPLERQGWYHGAITRVDAETTLRPLSEGSFLVRNCESTKQDYSLSLKGAKGFMHMRIQRNETGQYILGQFSRPFETVPDMIRHFCLNRLPVRGAEHMCLIDPVIAQLL